MAGRQPVEVGRERPYVPAIHALFAGLPQEDADARDKRYKRGHDAKVPAT
jgi:hypothetical protein